jgi:hypothetical protein
MTPDELLLTSGFQSLGSCGLCGKGTVRYQYGQHTILLRKEIYRRKVQNNYFGSWKHVNNLNVDIKEIISAEAQGITI